MRSGKSGTKNMLSTKTTLKVSNILQSLSTDDDYVPYTLVELASMCENDLATKVTKHNIRHVINNLELSYKKNPAPSSVVLTDEFNALKNQVYTNSGRLDKLEREPSIPDDIRQFLLNFEVRLTQLENKEE